MIPKAFATWPGFKKVDQRASGITPPTSLAKTPIAKKTPTRFSPWSPLLA
jgi:hypothetical protein